MYHAFVRHQMRSVFDRLNARDWAAVLRVMRDDVKHALPGDTAVGGERRSRAAVAQWFERFSRLFPTVEFDVEQVASSGWPWSTWVAVSWVARVRPAIGPPYENRGSQWVHLRWGRVTALKEHHDVKLVAEACGRMAEAGIDEAAAAPITG